MVREWVRDPSPDLSRAPRDAGSLSPKSPTVKFHPGERFAFDGKARLPNFLNGRDGQMGEARAHIRPVDTSTHTTYNWSGAGTGLAGQSLAADLARSLNGVSSLRAGAARSSTARSLAAADTRYHHLAEPAAEHVGPGAYAVERALPGLGPMPHDSHTSSSQPQRDPYRASAPFVSPERDSEGRWVMPQGPDVVYISPQFQPAADHAPPWDASAPRQVDAADWRFGHSRVMQIVAAARGTASTPATPTPGSRGSPSVPDTPCSSDNRLDVSGRPLEVALAASMRNAATSMRSGEARILALPAERHVDLRAARHATSRGPEETAHLGPGAYSPLTSVGGARRRSYRHFVDPFMAPQPSSAFMGGMQADAASIVHAHGRAARRAAAQAASAGGSDGLTARSSASFTGGTPRSSGRLAPSANFSSPFRGQKSGAHDWTTDSRLVRH
ncbi:hypothetical protein HXX76_014864 [Chlamydomonas incerta]|uniref:Uncharacterized protein n=1 Tax=Chlamydomonas incerta TaxID=51695 RepID=A0A835SB45_CHLIN|nr:hypothetical protein HXX76_014864 [Chlamydomonas incerta]|eukprot:KAG2424042.1 hypothetical protein HXX76_014864 [Chlamydomonas incerta]